MTIRMVNKTTGYYMQLLSILSRMDYGLLFLLLMPWLLVLIYENWIFSPAGTIDPWFYFGYFNNFGGMIKEFSGTYYSTRLPWIIPGYICYKIFPPLVANYILHAGFYSISVISLYLILKHTQNTRAALISSIFMGIYPFFLGAVGWDYIDGAGITYFLLTILFLTLAMKNTGRPKWTISIHRFENEAFTISSKISIRSAIMLLLSGASLALFIYTNTFLGFFTPFLAIYFFAVNRPLNKGILFVNIISIAIGFIALTFILGIINMMAGGTFLFFLPSFSYGVNLLGQPNPWKIEGYRWLLNASWLIVPFAVFITGIISILYRRFVNKSNIISLLFGSPGIFTFCYILSFLMMSIMEFSGMSVLELTYYSSYLIPLLFLAIGEQISVINILSRKHFLWFIVPLIILLLVSFHPSVHTAIGTPTGTLIPALLICLGILLISFFRLYTKITTIGTVLLIAILLGAGVFTLTGLQRDIYSDNNGPTPKQVFQTIVESDKAIREFDTTGDLRYWYSGNESLGPLYTSITSTRLWGYRVINDRFPSLESLMVRPGSQVYVTLNPYTQVAILSSEDGILEKANAALADVGQYAELIKEEHFTQGPISFTMTFIVVKTK